MSDEPSILRSLWESEDVRWTAIGLALVSVLLFAAWVVGP